MARFTSGWIKLHREVVEKDIGQDLKMFGLFTYLLLAATIEETTINWEGKPRRIGKGSVVFGIKELAERFGVSRDTISRKIKYLQMRDTVSLETSPRGCLIKINKFEDYQLKSATTRQQPGNRQYNNPALNREVKNKRINIAHNETFILEELKDPSLDSLLEACSKELQHKWVEVYKDSTWIKDELKKASIYLIAHPEKYKRAAQFLSNWLSNGFTKNPPQKQNQKKQPFNFGDKYA